mmetsp:Transcript_19467/g.57438  ORF Transcript_19467/g.57438 Transcript_19467/m.57438 type:complete len:245 (+) Transcript_19467:2688-3422(+)
MLTASSTEGSATSTCWKRRSRAASFSMYWRYSLRVVAPMQRSSPRASMGLSRLLASMAPPEAPAPTTVCSSSMKRTISPSAFCTSSKTALRRSSNSPRYLAPAMRAPMSRETTRQPWSESGTSPAATRCARPSTTAVLPTPGSPRSTGLFLERRERMATVRRISSSRPMTGSSLPLRAASVRSRPYRESASKVSSDSRESTRRPARTASAAATTFFSVTPAASRALRPARGSLASAVTRWDALM